ncbi:MAG: hypothetical protein ACRBB0_17325 [Pelagimonas sp.]|uniref:hypothetical protein n=1 Tax=Pelagimonas sp. TaxID=2073170 RepID=UPI003D6A0113
MTDMRTREVASVFEKGCLNPKRSMRQAIDVFRAAEVSHREPYTRGSSSARSKFSADIMIGQVVSKPAKGDRTWDTRLLSCRLKRVGTFAKSAHAEAIASLARQGFKPSSPQDALTQKSSGRYEGVYRLEGQTFDVLVYDQVARNPRVRQVGNVRYIRGNSYTILKISETK